MRTVGIVREVDELGRVVIPIETRRMLLIELGDPLEFFVDDTMIMMRKYNATACLFCNNAEDTRYFKGKFVCADCLADLVPGGDFSLEREGRQPVSVERAIAGEGEEPERSRKRGRSAEAVEKLKTLRQMLPEANQRELAERMGVSQGRVSQLMKLLASE